MQELPTMHSSQQLLERARYSPQDKESFTRDNNWNVLARQGQQLSSIFQRPRNQAEAEDFWKLYRQGLSEFSRLHAFSPNKEKKAYAEQALVSAHYALFRYQRLSFKKIAPMLIWGFPALVQKYWKYHSLSLVLTLVACGIAFGAVLIEPESYFLFVDQSLAAGRDPGASREFLAQSLGSQDSSLGQEIRFASFLFTHNTKIAFLCFSLGIALGVPTLLLLIQNGLMLGAFCALFFRAGLSLEFFAWILPHGVPEIGSILLCGGAGLALGHSLLNPGSVKRSQALARRARDSCLTVLFCVPLLLLAALIEGIFRQSNASLTTRYLLFGVLFLGIGCWLFFPWQKKFKPEA